MLLAAGGMVHNCHITSLPGCRTAPQHPERAAVRYACRPAAARLVLQRQPSATSRQQRRSSLLCWSQAPAAGSASAPEQEQAEEQQTEEEEESEEDEGWGEDSDFMGLSEEELAAQDAAFSQEVLTQDMLAADSATHATGAAPLLVSGICDQVSRHLSAQTYARAAANRSQQRKGSDTYCPDLSMCS